MLQEVKQGKSKKFSSFLNNKLDYGLIIIILLLLSLGVVMVLSASAPSSLSQTGSSYYYFKRQLLFAILGLVVMMFVSKIDYRKYKKYYKIIYVISVAVLILVKVPGLGKASNGALRWIKLGPIGQFQPSEITKIGMIIFYAGYLSDHKKDMKDFWKGVVKPLAFLLPPIGILYIIQNHLSASIVIATIASVMLLVSGIRLLHFAYVSVAGISGVLMMLKAKSSSAGGSFRANRIKVYLNPWSDATGTGYQVIQSLYAIGSGGLFGVGLGNSKQKYLYIPEPQNDFIFAILAEELGFVGCVIVVLLFAAFVWRGVIISMKSTDTFGSLLAIGITTLIGIQAIINIAVVTGAIPTTGMPLPFFSYGGTALVILLASCGVLLNVSRSTSKV